MYRVRAIVVTSVLATVACVSGEESSLSQASHGGSGGGGEDSAKSGACAGAGYTLVLQNGQTFTVATTAGAPITIPAASLGTSFAMRGTNNEFEVEPSSFAIHDWAFTGAPNPEGMTGGQRMVMFAAKQPDHRGLVLTSDVTVDIDEGSVVVSRSGAGVTMKIQANDCASGGVLQVEVERADGAETRFTHLLGPDVFFYDNPNFRDRQGETFQFDATTLLTIAPRINFSSDLAPALVGRDSPQEATRVATGCPNQVPNLDGSLAAVDHCGGRSDWSVKSGGRVGQVMGEDAIALEPPQPVCTHQCKDQSQIKGRGLNVGFPSPVPASARFSPRQ